MADIISLGASIITLIQTAYAIQEAVRRTVALHRKAPEEIVALQKQVEIFQALLLDARTTGQQSGNGSLHAAISEAQAAVDDVLSFICQKLMRQGGGSYQARRKAWLRHKSKVVALGDRLKESRENVSLALNTSLLYAVNPVKLPMIQMKNFLQKSRSTSNRIDSKSADIDRRLGNIESGFKSLTATLTLAIQEHKRENSLSLPLSTSQSGQLSRKSFNICEGPWPASDKNDIDQEHKRNSGAISTVSILGTFERGESFLPETYTMGQSTPRLFCYDAFEAQVSEFQRIIHCSILYSHAPRRWLRLTAIVTVSIESRYWSTWNVKTREDKPGQRCHFLPSSLEREFESQLKISDGIRQDSVLEAYSGGQPDIILTGRKSVPSFDVKSHLSRITNRLYHQGFNAYNEKHLAHEVRPGSFFFAKVPGRFQRWLEVRFRSIKSQLESNLNWLDVITSCASSLRIAAFGGLILDDEGIATGFLVEMPTSYVFDCIRKPKESGQPLVSWERREKWCKQLIQAVSVIHGQGKVVGSLGGEKGVGVDADDNLILWADFWTTIPYNTRTRSYLETIPITRHEDFFESVREPNLMGSNS